MKHANYAFAVPLIVTAFLLIACDHEAPQFPSFVQPAKAEGFTTLAEGSEARSVYAFVGTDQSFEQVKATIEPVFVAHGWTVSPPVRREVEPFTLFAEAPDRSLCADYWDLSVPREQTRGLERLVQQRHPDAFVHAHEFHTVVYVSVGECP